MNKEKIIEQYEGQNWYRFIKRKNKREILANAGINASVRLGHYRDCIAIYAPVETLNNYCCTASLVAAIAEVFDITEDRILPEVRIKLSSGEYISAWKTCMDCNCAASKRMTGRE